MWCDPPSIPSADIIQPSQSNWSKPFTSSTNDKKQLSFVYQPGVGLYDKKKTDLDQDLRIISTTADVDERIQVIFIFYIEEIISFFFIIFQSPELSPLLSPFTSDVDHRCSPSSSSSSNLYKSYLRRQNEQDSLPIREKSFSSDDIWSDKNQKSSSNNHIKLFDINISTK